MLKEKLNMDKNTKVILLVLAVYFVIMMAIFLPIYIRNHRDKLYIITNSNIKIKYEKGKWSKAETSDYNQKKFEVYIDDIYKGKYEVIDGNNERILLMDNGTKVSTHGYIFGYAGSLKLETYDEKSLEMNENDKDIISKVLSDLNLSPNHKLSSFSKRVIDVDKDGIEETIYTISNFSSEEETKERFSLLFMNDDDKITMIAKEITDNDGIYDSKIYSVFKVLDIRKDKKLELLYQSGYTMRGDSDSCVILYNLAKKKEIKNFCEEK